MVSKLLLFFLLISLQAAIAQKQSDLDSLTKELVHAKDTVRVKILAQLCWEYRNTNSMKVFELSNEGIKLARQLRFRAGEADLWNKKGVVYRSNCEYWKAIACFDTALSVAQKSGIKAQMAYAYNNFGTIYNIQNNFNLYLEYSLKAAKLFEEIHDNKGLGFALLGVAGAYVKLNRKSEALHFGLQSLKVRENQKQFADIGTTLRFLGVLYYDDKNYDKAKFYLLKMVNLFDQYKLNSGSSVFPLLAKVYIEQHKYDSAYLYAKRGLDIDKIQVQTGGTVFSGSVLAKVYACLGKYDSAYFYVSNAFLSKDSLYNEENSKLIAKYALNQKQEELKLAEQDKMIQTKTINQQIRQQRWIVFSAFAGIFSILLITFFVYRSRLKIKIAFLNLSIAKQEIDKQKLEISLQSDELKVTNAKLLEMDEFKQGMTSMIVHDLKNPLNAILNSSEPNEEKYKNRINQLGKQMLHLVLNILDVYKFEDQAIVLNIETFSVLQLANESLLDVLFLSKEKNIFVDNQINPSLLVDVDGEMIKRVFVNLLTNAIKYTPNNGKIDLYTEYLDIEDQLNTNYIKICIKDNGIGIPVNKKELVFQKFGQVQALNSGTMKSTGLGLTYCKMVVEAGGGQINFDSNIDFGSTFWFTLRYNKDLKLDLSDCVETQPISQINCKLSNENILLLEFYLLKLNSTKFYEISVLTELLNEIDVSQNLEIAKWKEQLVEAIDASNEELYLELIELSR